MLPPPRHLRDPRRERRHAEPRRLAFRPVQHRPRPARVTRRPAAGQGGGELDRRLYAAPARPVGGAARNGGLQVRYCRVQLAQRGGRHAQLQLDRAHVDPGAGAVGHVLAPERLEPRSQELDVLGPGQADGDGQSVHPGRHAHGRGRRPGPGRSGQGVGRRGPGAVAPVQADQRERERGEDGGQAPGGVHDFGPDLVGKAAEEFDHAGGLEPDVQAHLAEDHRVAAERDVVSDVAHQLERLPGHPHRLAEAPGGRLRTSANSANRCAALESAPRPASKSHRDASSAWTADSPRTSRHRPYGGELPRSAARPRPPGRPGPPRRRPALRPAGSCRSPPRPCTAPDARARPGHHPADP